MWNKNKNMDKKSKIFFIVFFLLIAGSVGVSYYKFIVKRNYIVEAQADCDPYVKKCFVSVCDPSAGEECTGNPEEDTSYYKIIHRNAQNIPLCDPKEEGCDALACPSGEAECEITFCDPTTAEKDGVVCSDPIAYMSEHPIEENDAVEGDGADATAGDSSEETMQVRDHLALWDEMNCDQANTFVFADPANKTSVDTEGNYEAVFSAEEAQIIFLANENNQVCAQAVSLPDYNGKIYLDAKSTAETFVFRAEGILTTDPEEAANRLDIIRQSALFPKLLTYVTNALPQQDVATISQRSDFQTLVQQCAADVLSKLR